MFKDYGAKDATDLAGLVASGEVDADALLDTALAAMERLNPKLNAVVLVQEEAARAAIRRGLPEGPFRGVPFLLKDLGCEAMDFPSHNGSRLFANTRYALDSAIWDRIRATGVVAFARTTAPEGGVGPATESAVYGGPTRNPWDLSRTPGGSSGGAGRNSTGRARLRRWWIGSHSGIVLRAFRLQGDTRALSRRPLQRRGLGGNGDRRLPDPVGARRGGFS